MTPQEQGDRLAEKDAEIEHFKKLVQDTRSGLLHELGNAQAEIERLKALLSRSADALERSNWVWHHGSELIAELRKAAE
jgi:septal ring factor EnvC (AmiA/AmiB activator)